MENKILCNIVLFEATKDNKSDYIIDHKVQHMHLVSKKEIKENDWYLYKHFGEWIPPCKFKGDDEINTKQNLNSKPRFFFKVEATTDKKLDLPLIPKRWVEEEYHFNIKEVYIDGLRKDAIYFQDIPSSTGQPDYDWCNTPKEMAGFRDEIIITPVKINWNKEELKIELKKAFYKASNLNLNIGIETEEAFDNWFNKNY